MNKVSKRQRNAAVRIGREVFKSGLTGQAARDMICDLATELDHRECYEVDQSSDMPTEILMDIAIAEFERLVGDDQSRATQGVLSRDPDSDEILAAKLSKLVWT